MEHVNRHMRLMDLLTAYLYGALDLELYLRVPEGLKIPNPKGNCNIYIVRLQRSMYGSKQSGRMWFNQLNRYLLKRGFPNNYDCPPVFIKKSLNAFCIISVYVNYLNILGTTQDIKQAMAYLNIELEIGLGENLVLLGPIARASP